MTHTNPSNSKSLQLYLVQGEIPTSEQVLGPGGIRTRKGQMASQFKNPIPYIPPKYPTPPQKTFIRQFGEEILWDIAQDVWREVGAPIAKEGAKRFGRFLSRHLFGDKTTEIKARRIQKNNISSWHSTVITDLSSWESENIDYKAL